MNRKLNEVKYETAKLGVSFKKNPIFLESIDADHNLLGGEGGPILKIGNTLRRSGKRVAQTFQPVSGSKHTGWKACATLWSIARL